MIKQIHARIIFAWKHKTLRNIAADPADPTKLCVYNKGCVQHMNRICPHQGADLIHGWVENNKLVCSWHGCKIPLRPQN